MAKENWTTVLFAEMFVTILGWTFWMAALGGIYLIGYGLAQHFGGAEHRESFGILSAVVFIWIYEHRLAQERWMKLLNQERG